MRGSCGDRLVEPAGRLSGMTAEPTAKFVQISSGLPWGAGLVLFALDDNGDVWQHIVDREPYGWTKLPTARLKPSGSPASR